MSANVDIKVDFDFGTIAFLPIVPFWTKPTVREFVGGQMRLPEFGPVEADNFISIALAGLEPGSKLWLEAQDEITLACFEGYPREKVSFTLKVNREIRIPVDGFGPLISNEEWELQGRSFFPLRVGEYSMRLTESQKTPFATHRPLRLVGKTNCCVAGEVVWWNRWRFDSEQPGAFELFPR